MTFKFTGSHAIRRAKYDCHQFFTVIMSLFCTIFSARCNTVYTSCAYAMMSVSVCDGSALTNYS